MGTSKESSKVQNFDENDPGSCRVETQGGTVYWISNPEPDGTSRWVMREHLRSSETNTMVMQPITNTKEGLDLGDKFQARLGGDIVVGRTTTSTWRREQQQGLRRTLVRPPRTQAATKAARSAA